MVAIETIKSAIVDREEDMAERFREEDVILRECVERAKSFLGIDMALIITGPRRCGKSFLAWTLRKNEKFGYVNFEDDRLMMDASELNKVIEALYSLKRDIELLIFDEIQNVPGWERFVARMLTHKKVIITGSNARLLSKELSTYLTGRHIDFTLLPFSFREFLTYKGFDGNIYLTSERAKLKEYLREYMEIGGFPLAYRFGRVFLAENYRDIVERDIVQRYSIRYVRALRELSRFLITNTATEISFNRLKNMVGVKSPHTIKNYVEYLENAYILFLLERFSYKLREQTMAPKKVYAMDTGLARAVGFRTSENIGRLMETVVAIELQRRKNYWNPEREIYYWKDHQQREVDFVIKEGAEVKELIQVTHASDRDEIESREIKALLKAGEELRCKNLKVITWDYEGEEEMEGRKIDFISMWKWLLSYPIENNFYSYK